MPRVSLFPEACHRNTFNKFFKQEKSVFMSVKIKNVICSLYLPFLSFKAVNWKQLNKKILLKWFPYAKKVLDTKKGQQVENVTSIGMSGQWFESLQIQIDQLKKNE